MDNYEQSQPTDFIAFNTRALRDAGKFSRQQVLDIMQKRSGLTMNPTTLRRIESGEQQAKAVEAAALANVFGIGLEEFIKKPIDGRLSEYYDTYDNLVNAHRGLYETARRLRSLRSEARRLLRDETRPEIKYSSISQKLDDFIKDSEFQDEIAKDLIFRWKHFDD